VWFERYNQINEFERYLYENNIKTVKLFLHISKDEQKKRLEDKSKDPSKHWKFSEADIIKRKYWDQYIQHMKKQ
jgi:polyphosphate kinase 2 (PPK2 family)